MRSWWNGKQKLTAVSQLAVIQLIEKMQLIFPT